jgi:hypothetical protein
MVDTVSISLEEPDVAISLSAPTCTTDPVNQTQKRQEALSELTKFMSSLFRYHETARGDDIGEDDVGSIGFIHENNEIIFHVTDIASIMQSNEHSLVLTTGKNDAMPSIEQYTPEDHEEMTLFTTNLEIFAAKLAWAAKLSRIAGFGEPIVVAPVNDTNTGKNVAALLDSVALPDAGAATSEVVHSNGNKRSREDDDDGVDVKTESVFVCACGKPV